MMGKWSAWGQSARFVRCQELTLNVLSFWSLGHFPPIPACIFLRFREKLMHYAKSHDARFQDDQEHRKVSV